MEGYQPTAYNETKTLTDNEAENVFTFRYRAVAAGTESAAAGAGTTDNGGTAGTAGTGTTGAGTTGAGTTADGCTANDTHSPILQSPDFTTVNGDCTACITLGVSVIAIAAAAADPRAPSMTYGRNVTAVDGDGASGFVCGTTNSRI